jgi:hypothetical protein
METNEAAINQEARKVTAMPCKLCHCDEPRCNSESLILCARCFQAMANPTQDQIKKAYELAVAKGYPAKAQVLQKFILSGDTENGGEQINVRRETRHAAERFDRGRAFKADRAKKVPIGRLPKQEKAPIPENQSVLPVVS